MTGFADRNGNGMVEVNLDVLLDRLALTDGHVPSEDATAAIAAAIGTHLTDRARASADDGTDSAATVSPWTFSGRLERTGRRATRRPRQVERGSEWQAAARSR